MIAGKGYWRVGLFFIIFASLALGAWGNSTSVVENTATVKAEVNYFGKKVMGSKMGHEEFLSGILLPAAFADDGVDIQSMYDERFHSGWDTGRTDGDAYLPNDVGRRRGRDDMLKGLKIGIFVMLIFLSAVMLKTLK